ncbi:MAG: PAS domain S-box protein, partial [Phormidesmis sp.]
MTSATKSATDNSPAATAGASDLADMKKTSASLPVHSPALPLAVHTVDPAQSMKAQPLAESPQCPRPTTQDSLNTQTLKQIFQLSPIGMTVLDLSGGFLSANQSFCEAVGYSERELVMLTFTDLTHPEDVPLLRSLGEQLLSGERLHFQVETRHWGKYEKPLHVGLTVTIVRDNHQRPICFLLQVVNLTERKWMEEKLRHRDFYDALTGLA